MGGDNLQSIIERSAMSAAMLDRDFRYLAVSPRWRENFEGGGPAQSFLGRAHYDVFPDLPANLREAHHRALAGETVTSADEFVVRANGAIDDTRWEMHPWRDSDGVIGGIVIFSEMGTLGKRAKEKVELVQSAIDIGFFEWRLSSERLSVDAQWRKIFGLAPDAEPTYAEIIALTHPEDREQVDAVNVAALACGGRVDKEFRIIRGGDSEVRWIECRGEVTFDDNGCPQRMGGATWDITDRKQAEDELRLSQARLSLAQAAADIGVWDWNLVTNEVWFSEKFYDLLGLEHGAPFPYEEFLQLIHEADRAHVAAVVERAIACGGEIKMDYRLARRSDGVVRWFTTKGRAFLNDHGAPARAMGAVLDVTERREAADKLQRTVERLDLVQAAAKLGVWDWDVQTDEAAFNDEYYDLLGLERGAPHRFADFLARVHLEDRAFFEHLHHETVHPAGRLDGEFRIIRADDGDLRWLNMAGRIVSDGDGYPQRVTGAMFDVTGRKRAEEALKRSEAEARRKHDELEWIYQNAPIGLCFLDRDFRYRRINRWLAEANGLSVEDHINQSIKDVVPGIAPRVEEIAQRVVETGAPVRDQHFIGEAPSKPGKTAHWNASVYPVHENDGSLSGFGFLIEEITERKEAEEALRRSEADARRQRDELEWIYQNAPIGLCFLDRKLRHLRINRWLANRNGLPVDAHYGKSLHEIAPAMADAVEAAAREIVVTKRAVFNVEFSEESRAAGVAHYWSASVYPAFGLHGEVAGFGAVVEEVTDSKHAEALRMADHRKNEFLATLAHELRNPLTPVRNAIYLLRMLDDGQSETREKRREALARAERQVNHLVRIVDDLLEMTRITHGKIDLRRESIDLLSVLQYALDLSQPLIMAKGHYLTVELPAYPLPIVGDSVRLAQVFANIINNAAKYTDAHGAIEISARRGTDEAAVVSVRDNGVGVPREMLGAIFEMFTQLRPATTRPESGIGVGLALSRAIVELHGGSIEVHSDGVGAGAEFIIHLPLATRLDATKGPEQ